MSSAGWFRYSPSGPWVAMADPAQAPSPLPPDPPPRWAQREDRVAWVLEHFTAGELARLYELQHNAGQRMERVRAVWHAEKAGLPS